MEIGQLLTVSAHEEGAWVSINNPLNGEKTDIEFLMAGVDSKLYRSSVRKVMKRALDNKAEDKTLDEEEATVEILLECTLGWRGILKDGKDWEFCKENVRIVYEQSPDIRRQVEEFISNRVNFIKG